MRAPLVLAMTLAAPGCGGRVAFELALDGGSTQASTRTYTSLPTSSFTGYVTSTAPGTVTETEPTTSIETASAVTTGEGVGPAFDAGITRVGPIEDAASEDAASCMISTSNYDQSCTTDHDCVNIPAGNFCVPGCICNGGTINSGAVNLYNVALAQTPLAAGAFGSISCQCADVPPPCCRQGICTLSNECTPAQDTLPACADAGGTCVYAPSISPEPACPSEVNTMGSTGPACAYADDEACCLMPMLPDAEAP